MSEEEIIKIIKEMIQWSDHSTYKMAIQGLLDLYNKEKEKNKNSISKNKIKEIIKKVDDCSTDMAETVVFWLEELLKE